MELGDFWERQAEDWVRWAREPGHDSYWHFHRDRFLELLPAPGRLTVDVGCGEGRLSRHLKEFGP
jgi:SAM-dependent methyltransferase